MFENPMAEKKRLSAGKSLLIFLISIVALVAEFIMYIIFGVGAALAGSVDSVPLLALFFTALFMFTGLIGFMAIVCALLTKLRNGEEISYKVMYYTVMVGAILCVLAMLGYWTLVKPELDVNKGKTRAVQTDSLSINLEKYKALIEISNINVEKGWSDYFVSGELKNTGTRSLDKVQLIIYALDATGKNVYELRSIPVLVSDFSLNDDGPLKPNYSRKFTVGMEEAPSDWNHQVNVAVGEIRFSK